jgi:hypothetical protein
MAAPTTNPIENANGMTVLRSTIPSAEHSARDMEIIDPDLP